MRQPLSPANSGLQPIGLDAPLVRGHGQVALDLKHAQREVAPRTGKELAVFGYGFCGHLSHQNGVKISHGVSRAGSTCSVMAK